MPSAMVNLALIGTGGMARHQAEQFSKIKGCRLVAACDVDEERVRAFASKFDIPEVYTDAADLLAKADVNAVSVVTPDAYHAPITLQALAAGKHVLCEKPLATNYADARKMTAAARKAGVVNMVQFSYRNSSALTKARALIAAGKLGTITHFEASYLQSWLTSRAWGDWTVTPAWLWRQSSAHGSMGVLGDIGVHLLDFATFPIGSDYRSVNCTLKTLNFIKGKKRLGYTLDANDTAIMQVELANGAPGVLHTTRWATGHNNSISLKIHGTEGALAIDLDKNYHELSVCLGKDRHTPAWKTLRTRPGSSNFQRFITAVRRNKPVDPDFARGAAIQKVIDACFVSSRDRKPVKI